MNPETPDGRPIDILLVEDNPGDVRLTREAFREASADDRLHVASNGEEALAFLRRESPFASSPRPDLILLDLNLPRIDGREVLREIKSDARLKRIPVVVLSTSRSADDIEAVYDLNANCYISKPVDLERFIEVVRLIQEFWLTAVKLPCHDG